jgi:hypothetical protein
MAVEETPFFDSRVVWWPSVRKRSAWSRAGWEMAGRWLGDGSLPPPDAHLGGVKGITGGDGVDLD